jgi:hypothetical protein
MELHGGEAVIKNNKVIKKTQVKQSPKQENNNYYIQIENTCDKIIKNIDKILNYLKDE